MFNPDVQARFRKGRGIWDQNANILWIIDKARELQKKTSASALLTMPSLWLFGSQQTVENPSRDWNTRPPDLSPGKSMQVKKQQVELDMEQQTGSNSGKDYIKAIYCHPAYLTYMHCTSWEKLSWMKHKLESRLWGEISITADVQMTPHLWQKMKKN